MLVNSVVTCKLAWQSSNHVVIQITKVFCFHFSGSIWEFRRKLGTLILSLLKPLRVRRLLTSSKDLCLELRTPSWTRIIKEQKLLILVYPPLCWMPPSYHLLCISFQWHATWNSEVLLYLCFECSLGDTSGLFFRKMHIWVPYDLQGLPSR